MRRSTTRVHGLSILALAMAVPLLGATAAAAQSTPQGPIPYDARRGVFSFASGLEQALPAVVQVTTLGQSEGPSSGENEPRPISSGSGAIIDAREGIVVTNNHVVEGGRKFTVDLTVEAPGDRPMIMGSEVVMARGLSARTGADGLLVFAVEGGSAAAGAGLRAGDIIRLVDDSAVTGLGELAAALDGQGQRVLSVMRDGEPVEVVLP